MDRINVILSVVFLMSATGAFAQYEDLRNSAKFGAFYQVHGFDGDRTKAAGLSFSYERSVGQAISWTVDLNFIERVEEPEELNGTVPQYNDVVQVKPGFRKYFDKALKGAYFGANAGLGIPKDIGASWEVNGLIGYQLRQKRVCLDAGLELGYGSIRFKEDRYENGVLISEEKYFGYGFVLRPMLRMGFAF